ncbi:DUF4880 domain-containing protein, partial [Brevundimonas sp.]|uniref:FecR/PupR family sigma factor regulator n=1 Tax=Brevundimonas sp. TaxID=1871086 RepID=UPI0019AEF62C
MSASDLNPIDAEAAAWAVKLDRPLPDRERSALEAWLAQDRRHRGALARAQAAYCVAAAPAQAAEPGATTGRPARRWVLAGAAGLAASLTAGGVFVSALQRQRLSTRLGEIRRVPLEDGSLAAINTDT